MTLRSRLALLTLGLGLAAPAAAQSWDQHLVVGSVETGLPNGVAAAGTAFAIGQPNFDPYNQPGVQDVVRVFELQGGSWVEVAELTSAEPFPSSASFGQALAMDGDLLAVGDPGAAGPVGVNGAVHLYRRGAAGGWSLEQVVRPATFVVSALEFGATLDLDGGRLVVGAPTATGDLGTIEDGAVYVFDQTPGGFVETQRLDNPDPVLFAHFGRSVDLNGDRLLIGTPGGSSVTSGNGIAHLYEDTQGSFTQIGSVQPAQPQAPAGFGSTVALDAQNLAASSPGAMVAGQFAAGQVHLFGPSGTAGGWTETAVLTNPTNRPYDRFGSDLVFEGGSLFATSENTSSALRFDSGPGGWFHAESYITESGLTWAPTMRVRVTSTGGQVFLTDPLGATVFQREVPAELEVNCTGDPHPLSATGFPVVLDVRGELSLSEPTLPLLMAFDAAMGPGVLFYGFGSASKPFSGTTLCVQGPVARAVTSGPPPSGSSFLTLDLDLQNKPVVGTAKAILPGVDAYFQYWFRVPGAGTTHLSSSLRTVFAP